MCRYHRIVMHETALDNQMTNWLDLIVRLDPNPNERNSSIEPVEDPYRQLEEPSPRFSVHHSIQNQSIPHPKAPRSFFGWRLGWWKCFCACNHVRRIHHPLLNGSVFGATQRHNPGFPSAAVVPKSVVSRPRLIKHSISAIVPPADCAKRPPVVGFI